MDKKDNPKALHTRKLKYSSEESEESEEEPQRRTKEPNLYKKVKVNSEGKFKKNVKASEDKSRHREDRSASHSSKRPETRSNNHDRKESKPDQSKDNKKKQSPVPDKKEKDKHDKKKDDLKKSKEKAEPEKSSKREHSKEEPAKQKNRNKTVSPPPPSKEKQKEKEKEKNKEREKEKEKEKEKENKKDKAKEKEKEKEREKEKEKEKEKEASKKSVPPPKKAEKSGKDKGAKEKDPKQMKLDLLLEAKADKKNKTKTKTESESEKQLADFTKKYPQFVYKGRFKFPIDDKLFLSYNTLLQEYIPTTERPTPKTGFIPPQALGDILQIWNFFNSFPELFKCQDIQKEEIYASMKYDGDEVLLLLNDMHQGLLSLFTHEFIKKNRFDTYKDEVENPFFILIKHHVIDTPIDGDELSVIWTEFARKLAYLPPYTDFLTETTKKFFDILAEKTCKYYNKLEYRMKPRILISIIEALYDTDVFRDFLQAKMDATSILIKERNDLEQEIRQEEVDQTNLKNKIKTVERGLKKEEQFRNSTLRLDSLRKQRDPETAKKELEENKEELEKLEESLGKKQTRLEEVNSELCMTMQTATLIGSDAHRSEYWIFQAEPGRLYVRHPEIVSGEEKWFYYDKKVEIDQLIKSLNVKGIKEKKLLQDLQDLVKNGKIKFEEDEEEDNAEQKKQEEEKKKAGKSHGKGGAAKAKDQDKMEEENEKVDKDEEEEEEEDDYVVRKKEDPEAAKKKMEEETEKAEKTEKVDKEEEEKKNEEIEKTKEQLKELEKEKQREKEALREKKKLEAQQQLTFEYWFAKLMEYETPDTIADEPGPEAVIPRVTRRQHQQQLQQQANEPSQVSQPRIRNPKDLDIKTIKEMVINTEKSFTIYLEKWEARWAHPIIKEELLEKLAKVEDIQEFAEILLKLNDYFQVSEAPRGRRGRPQRDRSQMEGDKEGEEDEEEEEEDVDDEDEEEEREEREREEYEREQEKQEGRENRDEEWDSKRSSKSMEEENASENQSAMLNQNKNLDKEGGMEVEPENNEQEDEAKVIGNASNNVTQLGESREKMETEKAETTEVSDEKNKEIKEVTHGQPFDERENAKKVKKFPIKFWGAFNVRLKKAWIAFTSTVDNLAALYFSADLLCRSVDTYVDKKSARYFTLYNTGKEYMAAKRKQKQEAMAQKSDELAIQPTSRYQNSEGITLETLDNYRHDKSRIMTRGNRVAAREGQSKTRSMAEAEADTIVGRLRDRFRPPKSYREPSYEYKPKFDERARMKLDELANLRRSVRLTSMSKKRYDNLNEQQWDTECKVCGKNDGQMVACSTCSDTYHPECAGIADLDVDREWTCADCLEKLASQRRTRSTSRKLQI